MAHGILGLNYVTATELNQGKSSSCLKAVHENNTDLLVIKQSTPYVVIVSFDRYNQLLEAYKNIGGMNVGRTKK